MAFLQRVLNGGVHIDREYAAGVWIWLSSIITRFTYMNFISSQNKINDLIGKMSNRNKFST